MNELMSSLLPNPNFREWVELGIKGLLREDVVFYIAEHTTVKDARESLAAVGELRAYNAIIATVEGYEASLAQAEEQGTNQEAG